MGVAKFQRSFQDWFPVELKCVWNYIKFNDRWEKGQLNKALVFDNMKNKTPHAHYHFQKRQ